MFQLSQKGKQYLYTINYARDEESLCKMEMKCLFNKVPQLKYFFSDSYIDPSRSPFIKKCISIIYTGETLRDVINKIDKNSFTSKKYKVTYVNYIKDAVGFYERRKIEYEVGYSILGECEMKHPEITFGITKVDDKWIFGECESNDSEWILHNKKPFSYSNALNINVSRAIVNIAVANNLKSTVVDPCCGIGTVIIEALSMGINIKGYEINPNIGENAKKNLKHFEYEDVITIGDMTKIEGKFDIAIVDLPYGLFTKITSEQQLAIISGTRRIADKMVIVTFQDMQQQIISCGFHIEDMCTVSKGKFKRYILICK